MTATTTKEDEMTPQHTLRIAFATITCAALAAPAALAGAEPKNELQFTGLVVKQASRSLAATSAQSDLAAEPKSQWPFTRPIIDRVTPSAVAAARLSLPDPAGEPKNDRPFTVPQDVRDHQQIKELVALFGSPWAVPDRPRGFAWGDFAAGIGAGIGVILLLAGVLIAKPVLWRQRTQTV